MALGLVRFTNALAGTGDFIYPGPTIDMQSPASGGAQNGATYQIYAQSLDMSEWEISLGAYNSATKTFARTLVTANHLGTTAKVNFTNKPQVFVFDTYAIGLAQIAAQALPPQGRLTLATGTPVMTSAQNNKTTLFYTPYVGGVIPIYDGAFMVPTAFTELSALTTDTTKSPAAIGASKVNDWLVWNDAGTIRLSHGPDWTSDTARSAGTALTKINGVWVNSVAITNGPAANRGTYVGTTRSNGTSTLDFSTGGSGAGGVAGLLNVWNAYNRVAVAGAVSDTTGTWNYTSNVARAANGSTNNRINFVTGLAEDTIDVKYTQRVDVGANSANMTSGWSVDTVSSYTVAGLFLSATAGAQTTLTPSGTVQPLLGYHFIQAIENSDNINANIWVGGIFSMLSASLRA